MIMSELNQFLRTLSEWNHAQLGREPAQGFAAIDDIDLIDNVGHDYMPGDMGVAYDYVTDDLTPEEKDEFIKWVYDVAWPKVDEFMTSRGYARVYDNDGSGNGLYYGSTVYRNTNRWRGKPMLVPAPTLTK